jgi:hypothetical protein
MGTHLAPLDETAGPGWEGKGFAHEVVLSVGRSGCCVASAGQLVFG